MAKRKSTSRKASSPGNRRSQTEEEASNSVPPTPDKNGVRTPFDLTDKQIERSLVTGEDRDLLEAYFGEETYDQLRSLACDAQRVGVRGGPRVLILPGLMGSRLGRSRTLINDTIWINPISIIAGRLRQLTLDNGSPDIQALGVRLMTYLLLKLRLRSAGLDAEFHAYDWRKSVPDLGKELADRIRQEAAGRAVGLVAHSMGGLVARAAWAHLTDRERERLQRLVTMGTPHYGSFAPVLALRGTHTMIRRLAALDLRHGVEELVGNVINTFPSLYEMLPRPERFGGIAFFDRSAWPTGGLQPREALLSEAERLTGLAEPDERFVQIVGVDRETVVDAVSHGGEFVYRYSIEGDGTVPLVSAQLEGVSTYFISEDHGSLPHNRDVCQAVIELLDSGKTGWLGRSWTPSRRGVTHELFEEEIRVEPFEGRRGERISAREVRHLLDEFVAPAERHSEATSAPGLAASPTLPVSAAVSREPVVIGRQRQHRLDLRLARGSISQVDCRAIVLGLFQGVAPTGPAQAVDRQLGGAIRDFASRRMFSGNVGEVFMLPTGRHPLLAELVMFAGLGTYDQLDGERLRVVAESVARTLVRTKVDEFATVMLGAGSGTNLDQSLANLIKGFLRGVRDAEDSGRMRSITLCETDPERYRQIHHELIRLASTSLFDDFELTIDTVQLPPEPEYEPVREAILGVPDPVYLIVRRVPSRTEGHAAAGEEQDDHLQASLLTAGGKATVITDTKRVSRSALDELLSRIRGRSFRAGFAQFAVELGELVLPELTAQAMRALRDKHLVVIHDADWARVPWEAVCLDGWFPAGAKGMGRRYQAENLSVAKWLEKRTLMDELGVLLIVDPTEDLPGARAEGAHLREVLAAYPQVKLTELRGSEATWRAVRAALHSGDYDVVHYAGHAYFDPQNRSASGIQCHGGYVLSGADLAGLEQLPALAFFNACESSRTRREGNSDTLGPVVREEIETNVGLAEAFLRGGIANYVGTYWPVADAPAKEFAQAFYQGLLSGQPIGAALLAGRHRLREQAQIDWANYIHYGSYGFVLKNLGRSQPPPHPFAAIQGKETG